MTPSDPKLKALLDLGQSIWIDDLSRGFVDGGGLAALVDAGVRGVTSNPAIFEQAIAHTSDYDEDLARILAEEPSLEPEALYERLAVEDIRRAADVLRPVYEASGGGDGYVSLEVSPFLADDSEGTVREATRLFAAIGRPNAMIKVPATAAGVDAVERLIAAGVNVNVTLIFAVDRYREVAEAYVRGLAAYARAGGDVARVASVASFFVSRVDTAVDRILDAMGTAEAAALRGRAAVANARRAVLVYDAVFGGAAFETLRTRGARPQRLLWASTGTKDPRYSDVRYVEELIGPDTVNTLPPATLAAFRDHGRVAPTLRAGVAEAASDLERLAALGVRLDAVLDQLLADGVRLFHAAYDRLLAALAERRAAVTSRP